MDANAIQFKGGGFTLSVLTLCGADLQSLQQQLADHIRKAPKLFAQMPVVLDLNRLSQQIPLCDVISMTRQAGLAPMAIESQQQQQQQQARDLGLPLFKRSRDQTQTPLVPPKVISLPVRSGQQIYAEGGDLIVLGAVSTGAEIVADGSIHVYGTLRGRAFAGANGLEQARIFCHNQQAELLSIAGHYQLSEQFAPSQWGQALMTSLQDQALIHQPIQLRQ
ncbi:septum site-determining protein MinC [Ferrimonas senticii]|uniref:septum site-determining protein MinC n=1 Tax=Ferrimonas senticii TaxID=394566 RepID=UPI00041B2783|nr:septum site-determining protein MinC [Ferrimonas senticii]